MTDRILRLLMVSALALACGVACDDDDDDDDGGTPVVNTTRPESGLWNGGKVDFNVSTDGTKLTATGSAITVPAKSSKAGEKVSLKVGPLNWSTASCRGTVTDYYTIDIAIQNMAFSYSSADGDPTAGTFESTTKASGTCSLSGTVPGCGFARTSSAWTTYRNKDAAAAGAEQPSGSVEILESDGVVRVIETF